ncbi:MAG: hypothetical protein K0R49_546 [Burkholderiales bacterium]|jgi:hypothetical protein|nr:hypothetical protein [Burkholderiales bacterium]
MGATKKFLIGSIIVKDNELLLRLTNSLKKLSESIQELEQIDSTTTIKNEILEKLRASESIQQKWINDLSNEI